MLNYMYEHQLLCVGLSDITQYVSPFLISITFLKMLKLTLSQSYLCHTSFITVAVFVTLCLIIALTTVSSSHAYIQVCVRFYVEGCAALLYADRCVLW
jgi:hypothetical protein